MIAYSFIVVFGYSTLGPVNRYPAGPAGYYYPGPCRELFGISLLYIGKIN
jgi:hypothetical protein